jgi:hypothetical protein
MITQPIIAAPLLQHPTAFGSPSFEDSTAPADLPRMFHIRAADAQHQRSAAGDLIRNRYAWRGYRAVTLPADSTTHRVTLVAVEGDETIGTITVGLDGPEGLASEATFAAEVGTLREQGLRVAEFTKLAIDPAGSSKRVLAALFHVACIVAHRIRGYDVLVMEVNPRHVRYYERKLGAQVVAAERANGNVGAPAVLLGITFARIWEQIDVAHGQIASEVDERTINPYFFTPR